MSNLILNKLQAEAVCSAMHALNNVSGAGWFRMPIDNGEEWADVRQDDHGAVHIGKGPLRRFDPIESVVIIGPREYHADQVAFAAAYNLQA